MPGAPELTQRHEGHKGESQSLSSRKREKGESREKENGGARKPGKIGSWLPLFLDPFAVAFPFRDFRFFRAFAMKVSNLPSWPLCPLC
jgi:hypothetical protein